MFTAVACAAAGLDDLYHFNSNVVFGIELSSVFVGIVLSVATGEAAMENSPFMTYAGAIMGAYAVSLVAATWEALNS